MRVFVTGASVGRDAVVDEATPLDDVVPAQRPRVRLEERALRAVARGVRAVVLRPAHVYGGGHAGAFTRLQLDPRAGGRGEPCRRRPRATEGCARSRFGSGRLVRDR